jgi:TolB-like protein/Flp pilus assembly protein TadD
LTGKAAFQGETASDVIAEILKGEPTPLSASVPQAPAQFEAMVLRAIRKNRDERYSSAAEMLNDLKEFRKESEFQEKLQSVSALSTTPKPGSGSDQLLRLSPGTSGRLAVAATTPRKRFPLFFILTAIMLVALALVATPWLRKRWAKTNSGNTPRTLAVLPFRNLRPDPQSDFLGFSMADAIITKLGYVNALTVRPSSSVDKYRNQTVDPQKVADELHVATLLTGTYMRDGDDLRIRAQLIDVKPDKILWQDTIDVKYERLLTVQDTVSQQIIRGLEVSLSPAEEEKLRPETKVNPAAYEYYLRGVDLYALDNFPGAVAMLEKAASADPNYAPTWAHLGRAYTTNASLQFGGREEYTKAQAAYEKAIALDPGLTEAHVYMANMLTDTGQVEKAVPLMRKVLAQNPKSAEAHWELGYAYRFGGMLQEAVAESELARQNDPSVKLNTSAMNAYLYLGEYDKFLQSLPSTDSLYVIFYRGFGEYHEGRFVEAARDFDHVYEVDPSLLPAAVGKALSYGIRGERAKGLQLLHATEKRILDSGVADAESYYKVCEAYAVLGDKSSAMLMFHRTVEGGFFPYPYFLRDPLLENIRREPELGVLMGEAQERYEQFKGQFF